MNLAQEKKRLRQLAFGVRKTAFETIEYDITDAMVELAGDAQIVSSYMPMRTEIDPLLGMGALVKAGKRVCVPVILGSARPLEFREWWPECKMEVGEFGAMIPVKTEVLVPELVFAPLVAFDDQGTRLGYGGGFYDRSLEQLRAARPTPYIGLAFEAQRLPERLPREDTDIALDGVITENGYFGFADF